MSEKIATSQNQTFAFGGRKESAKADSSTFDTHASLFGIVGRDGSLEILLDCARMLAGEQLR